MHTLRQIIKGHAFGGIFLAGLFLAAAPQLSAADKQWLGNSPHTGGNGAWNFTDRWDPSGVPGVDDTTLFTLNPSALVNIGNLNPTIAGMVIDKTGTTEFWTNSGSLKNLTFGSGGLTIEAGAGAVTFRELVAERVNPRINASQTWENKSTSLLTVGSSIQALNTPTLTVTGSGNMVIGDGFGAADNQFDSLIKSGAGTLTIGGAAFATNGSTVQNGTLFLNGVHAGAVTVNSGATLGGTGTLGATSVSGNLKPGSDGIGLLTFSSTLGLLGTSVTTMEIAAVTTRGTDYDAIDVTSTLTFGGDLTLDFDGAAAVGTYDLFDFAGASAGGFANVTLTGSHTGTLSEVAGIWTGVVDDLHFTFSEVSGDLTVESTISWIGADELGGDGDWDEAANWDPSGVPATGAMVQFTGAENAIVNLGNLQPNIKKMIISKTGTTFFRTVESGARNLDFDSGGLTIEAGAGAVTFSGVTDERVVPRLNADQVWQNNSGSLVTTAIINLLNTPILTVTGSGDIVIDGRIGVAENSLDSLIKSGTGTLTFNSTVFITDGNGSTVEGGTLLLNATHAGAVTVNSGATLGGTGTLGATSVSGNLKPGSDGIGLLTFSSTLGLLGTSVTTMEIAGVTTRGTDYDAIDVTSTLTFGGDLVLDFTGAAAVGTYDLFDFAGASAGDFASVTLAGSYAGSLFEEAGIWSGNSGGRRFTFSEVSGDLTIDFKSSDFADGTLQGWTAFGSSGVHVFAAVDNAGGWLHKDDAHSGDYQLTQILTTNEQFDDTHDTSWARSPEFYITAGTEITFQIWGGVAYNAEGEAQWNTTANPMDTVGNVPATTSADGFLGVALRKVSDNTFVALGGKNDGNSQLWSPGWWNADISTFASETETYTLDVIDQRNGAWGGMGIDTITIKYFSVWTGASDTDWDLSGNWSSNQLPSSLRDVIIPAVATLPIIDDANTVANLVIEVGGALTITGSGSKLTVLETLTIESDADDTGALIVEAGGAIAGDIIVQRHLLEDRWYIVGAPLNNMNIVGFLQNGANQIPSATVGEVTFYGASTYDEAINDWEPFFTAATPGNLTPGIGYLLRRTGGNGVVSFTGSGSGISTGTVEVSMQVENWGWNSVGNPYTSPIGVTESASSTQNFLAANLANLPESYQALYVWDDTAGDYRIVNDASNPFDLAAWDTDYVQLGQGFVVRAKDVEGGEKVVFTPGMRIVPADPGAEFQFMSVPDPDAASVTSSSTWPGIQLTAAVNSSSNSTVVLFREGMSIGLDPRFDAGVFKQAREVTVYTRLVEDNGEDFDVQVLPLTAVKEITVPVGVKTRAGGEVTFSIDKSGMPARSLLILEDRQQDTETNLTLPGDSYTTTVSASDPAYGRFFLVFAAAPPPPTFDEWAEIKNIPYDLREFADDPLGQGIPNVFSYMFGIDPLNPDRSLLPEARMSEAGDQLIIIYRELKDAPGIVIIPQKTDDLDGEWTNFGIEIHTVGEETNFYIRQASIPLGSSRRIFMRLDFATD